MFKMLLDQPTVDDETFETVIGSMEYQAYENSLAKLKRSFS